MSPFTIIFTLSLVGIFTIVINVITLCIICSSDRLRKPPYYPIMSFIVTGILKGVIVVPVYCVKRLELADSPDWVCDLFRFPYFLCGHMLTLSILLVAIERVVAIRFPFRHQIVTSKQSMLLIISSLWVVMIAIDLLPFINGSKQNDACMYVPWNEWSVAVLVITIVIPMLIIAAGYAWIWRQAVKHAEQIQADRVGECSAARNCSKRLRFRSRIELRATRTSLLLVGIFFVTWAPIGIYYLVENICDDCIAKSMSENVQEHFRFWVKVISFTSCICSPLAYCWRTREFRRELRSSLQKRSMKVPAIAITFMQRIGKVQSQNQTGNNQEETSI